MISINHTFIRFALVGVLNTLIGMGTIFVTWRFLGFSDLAANLTGYAIGFCCSYGLNRLWTFPTAVRSRAAYGASLLSA